MKVSMRHLAVAFMTLLCSVFLMNSGLVLAAGNPSYNGVDCAGAAAASPVCHASSTDPLTGNNGIIVKATNLIAIVAGVAAVIILIISGIKFITSQGDANAVGQARKAIIYSLVGIAVIVLAKSIITFVVSRV